MPRLTNVQYLYQRQRLRVSWQRRSAAPFSTLSATEQVRLWAYFVPTLKLTDKEAIAHRKMISERFLALPQQAGRAYVRALPYLDPEPRSGPAVREQRVKKPRGEVVIRGAPREKVDVYLLVRALISLANGGQRFLDVRVNEDHHEDCPNRKAKSLRNQESH